MINYGLINSFFGSKAICYSQCFGLAASSHAEYETYQTMVDRIPIFFHQVCNFLTGSLPCRLLQMHRQEQGGSSDAEEFASPGRL